MTTLLNKIEGVQPAWFSAENRRIFGDVRYYAYRSKKTNKPYLVRATYAWSDMFGEAKRLTFRVNCVNPDTLELESMTDDIFWSLTEAKNWVYEAV